MSYNENKKNYNIQYKKDKLKRVPLELPLDKYDEVKEHASKMSESVNGFIKRAIKETIERDNSSNSQ